MLAFSGEDVGGVATMRLIRQRSPGSDSVLMNHLSRQHIFPVASFALAILLQMTSGWRPIEGIEAQSLIGIAAITLVIFTIFAVLHHAEAIAIRVGEPYGTLVLTLAVTTIEVSIILSMMMHGGNNPTLARESVFSTVMIICTGVVGLSITLGAFQHKRQEISVQGATAFMSVLIALTGLTMVLPNYTLSAGTGTFTPLQLSFVALLSILLYAAFLFAQTVGQKADFLERQVLEDDHIHHDVHSGSIGGHFIFLFAGLIGIVLLTEFVASSVENALDYLELPQTDAIIGAMIALVILMPEAISAIKASVRNQLQRGLNIALGSACASIGLTIPAVSVASLIADKPITLGLTSGDTILLFLALTMSVVSFNTGRTTLLTGLAHLVLFVAYAMLIIAP